MDNTGTSNMICNLYMLYAYHNTETIYLRASVALLARDHVHVCSTVGQYNYIYPLVMTNIAMVFRWPIETDGLPFLNMVDLSMANCECHNQMVIITE